MIFVFLWRTHTHTQIHHAILHNQRISEQFQIFRTLNLTFITREQKIEQTSITGEKIVNSNRIELRRNGAKRNDLNHLLQTIVAQ